MQFLIIAEDAKDSQALQRRLVARDQHLEGAKKAYAEGKLLVAGALLGDDEQMNGSVLIVDFPDQASVEEWLEKDPYVDGNVWERFAIRPVKVAKLD